MWRPHYYFAVFSVTYQAIPITYIQGNMLAKVRVVSSNLIARSKFSKGQHVFAGPFDFVRDRHSANLLSQRRTLIAVHLII